MKRHFPSVAGAVTLTLGALAWSGAALAQGTVAKVPTETSEATKGAAERATLAQASMQPVAPRAQVVAATPAPVATETTGYSGPNRAMIGTGLVTFGLAYVPSVIVASQSSLDADHHLYVPVAGPWLDFANRPDCTARNVSCDTETTNRVLLVVSGVMQGVGAITTVLGFLTPEHERVVVADHPTLHVAPAQMGAGGVGAAAFGTF